MLIKFSLLNKKIDVYKCYFIFTFSFILFYNFFFQKSFAVEYYEVEQPYRFDLQQNYVIHEADEVDQMLDLENVHAQYIKNRNDIMIAENNANTKQEVKKKEEKNKENRQSPVDNKILPDATKEATQMQEKEKQVAKKTWLDDWIVHDKVKPMDVTGQYVSAKLMLTIPFDIDFSAKEITRLGEIKTTKNLFSGKSSSGFMPAVFLATGNDKLKWLRWEVELGYIPIRSSGISKLTSANDSATYTFNITKENLGIHLFTCGVNAYLQYAFFEKKIVGFFGLGMAMGYAWSWSRVSSGDFVIPVLKLNFGVSFMVRDKAKLSISYALIYTQVNLPNKYQFSRSVNGVRQPMQSIYNGSLNFGDIIIQGLSFDYQFYKD